MAQISVAAAVRVAAAWRSGIRKGMAGAGLRAAWLRQALLLAALVFAFPVLLGLKELSRIVRVKWAPWMIWPVIGMSVGAFGLEAHDAWRTLTNAPAMESAVGSPPAAEEKTSEIEGGGGIDESPEEDARMGRWERAVQQALKDAGAQQRDGATGAALTESAESKPQEASNAQEGEATAKARDPNAQDELKRDAAAGKQLNPFAGSPVIDGRRSAENQPREDRAAAKARDVQIREVDAGNAVNPFAVSPLIDRQQLDRNSGPINVIPFVKPQGPFWRMGAQVRGRRHWRVRHYGYGWAGIFRFPLIAVVR